jgi:hypothetical protein
MLSKLKGMGFDPKGVQELFEDVTGNSVGRITFNQFEKYLDKHAVLSGMR